MVVHPVLSGGCSRGSNLSVPSCLSSGRAFPPPHATAPFSISNDAARSPCPIVNYIRLFSLGAGSQSMEGARGRRRRRRTSREPEPSVLRISQSPLRVCAGTSAWIPVPIAPDRLIYRACWIYSTPSPPTILSATDARVIERPQEPVSRMTTGTTRYQDAEDRQIGESTLSLLRSV